MVKIAILGAGPIGLSCAVKIKETYRDFDVSRCLRTASCICELCEQHGIFRRARMYNQRKKKRKSKWSIETYNLYHELWLKGGSDVCMMPFFFLNRKFKEPLNAVWTNQVFGFEYLKKTHLQYFSSLHSGEFVQGHTFTTFVVTPTTILQYLTTRFRNAGGRFEKAEVSSLEDAILDPYDVIVNCTGLRARELAKDERVFPIRGQLLLVKAPWTTYTLLDNDGDNYIVPNVTITALGGTHQENDYNTNVDTTDAAFILNGCRRLMPGLEHAEIVRGWAGLRPARDETRLEAENVNRKLVIHNYGHGGSGMTFFWGCATDVLQLLKNKLSRESERVQNTVSKL